MGSEAPQPPPAACAECVTVTQSAQPGALPQQSVSQVFRSSDGKVRVDSGATSIITDPASRQAVILDHTAKVARAFKMPQMPPHQFAPPPLPGAPPVPALPAAGPVQVQELGKALIEGHPVDGKRFTFQPPPSPPVPGRPQLPGAPQIAGPGLPNIPAIPKPPAPPMVAEVWTSTQLHLPVLTKTAGAFGRQTCHCKCGEAAPPASLFQIPPGYRVVAPRAAGLSR